jgi:hypothetical protein
MKKFKSPYPDYSLMREELIAGHNAQLFYIHKSNYAFILSLGVQIDRLEQAQKSRLAELYDRYIIKKESEI